MEKTKPYEIPKRTMVEAYRLVMRNGGAAGIDDQTTQDFDRNVKDNLYKLWNRMSSGSYFPKAVLRVEIPKKSGGMRLLGIPTVTDRIAQMAARLVFEPMLEPHFHPDSYGYRPKRSAHQALEMARKRCWKYDWVIDLDIKGFFDTIDHELMLKAVDFHKPPVWVRLYIERWLKAPVQVEAGKELERDLGTPQGGVISPLLANLFLHYAFDVWMRKYHGGNPFERYADDIVIHCRTKAEAEILLAEIKGRLGECKLTVHPEKTKIVYCKDGKRRERHENMEFDFLSFTFRSRFARCKDGSFFETFTPAISKKAEKAIRDTMRKWRIHRATRAELKELSERYNPRLRGWFEYYGRFRPSAMNGIFEMFQKILMKWAKEKWGRFNGNWSRASKFIIQIARKHPEYFVHWQRGLITYGRV